MKHHGANQLYVEGAQPDGSPGSLSGDCKGFRQQVVQRFAIFVAPAEFIGLSLNRLVAERFQALFQVVDMVHDF